MVVAGLQKQEELHGGGKSGSLKVSSLFSSFFIFCIFFCYEKDDDNTIVVSLLSSSIALHGLENDDE
jgi:hypothetical protein